jgi:pimeloyl-ACP methyl ester carboxylesterase
LNNFKKYEENLTLIWGEKDESTPLYYAKNVHEKYPKSKLFIIKNAGHFPWIDNIEEFKKFL